MTWRPLTVAVVLAAGGACSQNGGSIDAGPDAAAIPPALAPFPQGFLWGTAIAPYQVEGNLHQDDWYAWESCSYCSGDHADDGPDFWDHYQTDLDNAAALGTNAIRLGIDWSRVFPTRDSFPGSPDADAVAHYHQILDYAISKGLNPMVTLHHFATPVWLAGWEDPTIVEDFATWSGWAAKEFGGEVDYWITLNEPAGFIEVGWVGGVFPPGKLGDVSGALTVANNMFRAHASAYDAIVANDTIDADGDGRATLISIASHNRVFLPFHTGNSDDEQSAALFDYFNNKMFLDALVDGNIDANFNGSFDDPGDTKGDPTLAHRLDFIGLNYYGVTLVEATNQASLFPFTGLTFANDLDSYGFVAPVSDYGGSIYPQGFRTVIDEIRPYNLPIIVTENGIADALDVDRPRFLLDHLYVLEQAIQDGVDVRGYFHWSLIDNFEWAGGFCPRFGLYSVDYSSPDRTRAPRASADIYRQIIQANQVPVGLYATYPTYPTTTTFCTRVGP